MKRILQFGGALLALGMLLASCNMGMGDGQVSGDFAERETSNINGITIGINSIVNTERTILPADWDDTTAEKLTYVLMSQKSGIDAGYTTIKTFSYAELKGGTAIVNLELTKWDLKLIGYITGSDENTKPCLAEEQKNLDFTTGKKNVTFNLKPVTTGTEASGSIKVNIAWLTNQPKRIEFGIYASSTDTETIIGDKGRTKVVDSTDTVSKKLNKIASGTDLGSTTDTKHILDWSEDDNIKAGMYKFAAVFYDNDDTEDYTGNVIGYYIDWLYVDGANLSTAIVNYGDKFNTTPENPTWLAVETVFNPQKGSETTSVNDWYLTKFHWDDNSNNETGFELVITEDDGTKYVVNPSSLNTVLKADTLLDGTTPTSAENNNLDAGSTSVILKLTTQKKYTAKIRAINTFTPTSDSDQDAKFCENLNRNGDGQGSVYAPIVIEGTGTTAKKQFGMFTVNYTLDGSQVTEKDGTTITDTAIKNYIVGYNYHSEQQDLMTDNVLVNPHITNSGFMFDHWVTKDSSKTEMPVIAAKNITNLELEPVWKGVDVRVRVTFPSYADAADVKIAADKNIDNTVTFKYDKTANNSVSVTAGASLTSPDFELTDSNGKEVTVGTSNSTSVWTWTPTTAPTPGYYCLQITGTYTDAGTGRTLILSGNVYINVVN